MLKNIDQKTLENYEKRLIQIFSIVVISFCIFFFVAINQIIKVIS